MSNYYGYVSVDALMDFAHSHVNGMIDSNDIARFPKANVKDANEQQSLQQIFGIPFARLRELAEAEREGRVVVLPCKVGDAVYVWYDMPTSVDFGNGCSMEYIGEQIEEHEFDMDMLPYWGSTIFATRAEAERVLAATAPTTPRER